MSTILPRSELSLSGLSELIKQQFQPLAAQSFWVLAEISELKSATSGHLYLDLVEQQNGQIFARMPAVIWAGTGQSLRVRWGSDLTHLLKKGNKLLLQGSLDYHSVYGFKFIVTGLDPSATLGDLELKRQAIIEQLTNEGLIGLNALQELPVVLQRLAIVSSPTAAGLGDFLHHLANNPYNYAVKTQLFAAAMQGDAAEPEVCAALNQIAQQAHLFDAVIIIRGGGSKLDLACFNSYLIGQTIANHPLPILTGIGHQQDDTIADLVAHTALKTPTAVAEMVLNSFLWFEGAIKQLGLNVQQFANQLLQKSATELLQLKQLLQQNTALNLNQQAQILQNNKQKLTVYTKYFLNTQSQYLAKLMAITNAYNVEKLLSRGFSITRCNGKLITDNEQVTKGQIIETVLHSGKLRSKVE